MIYKSIKDKINKGVDLIKCDNPKCVGLIKNLKRYKMKRKSYSNTRYKLKGFDNMKKIIMITMVLAFVFISAIAVNADDMQLKSVDSILTEIQQEQGVQSTDKINVDLVSQPMLEELGDSVMEAMIGNTETHDKMDISLGGDGSESLTAFHTRLGYNYLVGYPNGMMTLMTAGMMGNYNKTDGTVGWSGMMGNSNYRGYGGMMGYLGFGGMIIGAIIFILFMVILFFIMKAFVRKPNGVLLESPMDLLKKRYAKGELTQDEYEKMVEHFKK